MATATLVTGTSAPSTTPTALGTTAIDLGSGLHVFGALGSGSGNLQLCRWEPTGGDGSGAWYPYGATFTVDSAVNSGKYLQRYAVDRDSGAHWYLQLPGGSTSDHAKVRGVRL